MIYRKSAAHKRGYSCACSLEAKPAWCGGTMQFAVTQVNSSGLVHLIQADSKVTRPRDLGWFKVR